MRHHRRATRVLVTVGALVASRAAAEAGEIRGRILVAEKPAAAVSLSAVPFEEPEAEARRLARGGDAPRAVAVAATRNDGTFALALPATLAGEFRILAEGPAVVTAWVGG